MEEILDIKSVKRCSGTYILAVNETINVISGKWKLPIIGSLLFGKKRFKELEREIPKITPRMLSKELRDLEVNGIVTRTVYDTIPVTVEYELTPSGRSFSRVLDVMLEWGLEHRRNTLRDSTEADHRKLAVL
ncbi:MAG: helix-turn-helix transcriptional regulator [Leadbetterella sp.]|nr:helix-turn-helix transcriptional regulator [Leadbetterella sp.]